MLVLKDIVKDYQISDTKVEALRGVTIEFRKNEFVSILGPSGCGKTTLLNIVGGLDRYTSGDLSVNGVSTKQFTDDDWDAYRNRSIGFVFQSYNLIPHQTVLANVELAMTLSGVSKADRKKRAIEALTRVGLGDQIHKKPNQCSGGQMQRVAIARALVNDPEILLADEPTGAIDSATSVQIMDILKEIAKDRLVIMVTHNPELAEQYSTRIIRLLDGRVIDDTNPYHGAVVEPIPEKKKARTRKKKPMTFLTALSLSLNNLMTKKTRTLLTAFAGSIGIIGIALILSLSSGVQGYITKVEEDTLSSYPIMIEQATMDFSSLLGVTADMRHASEEHDKDRVYANAVMEKMVSSMMAEMTHNDLKAFKEFIESPDSGVAALSSAIQYNYSTPLNIYAADTSNGAMQVSPSQVFSGMGMGESMEQMKTMASSMGGSSSMSVWQEMLDNDAANQSQYDVLAGRMPVAYNEVVLIVDEDNEITDLTLYALGLKDPRTTGDLMTRIFKGEAITESDELVSYSYDEIMGLKFKVMAQTDLYEHVDDTWVDQSKNDEYLVKALEDALELTVVGVLRPSGDALAMSANGSIGYTAALTRYVIDRVNDSEIVGAQQADPEVDVFTGKRFDLAEQTPEMSFDPSTLTAEQQAYLASLKPEEISALMRGREPTAPTTTYDQNISTLGVVSLDNPSGIHIYPKNFEAKDELTKIISDYNRRMTDAGKEEYVIQYTDYVGLMMSSVSTIINTISYVLIAFVAISLVVSSIMIGIITYISVLERTKEIGILRSIGASKKDIARVFNAETLIVGFTAGALGIGVTLLLCIPINAIILSLSGISGIAALPLAGGGILVLISMCLTFVAGLIPSRIAAKKDPVVALRTE